MIHLSLAAATIDSLAVGVTCWIGALILNWWAPADAGWAKGAVGEALLRLRVCRLLHRRPVVFTGGRLGTVPQVSELVLYLEVAVAYSVVNRPIKISKCLAAKF